MKTNFSHVGREARTVLPNTSPSNLSGSSSAQNSSRVSLGSDLHLAAHRSRQCRQILGEWDQIFSADELSTISFVEPKEEAQLESSNSTDFVRNFQNEERVVDQPAQTFQTSPRIQIREENTWQTEIEEVEICQSDQHTIDEDSLQDALSDIQVLNDYSVVSSISVQVNSESPVIIPSHDDKTGIFHFSFSFRLPNENEQDTIYSGYSGSGGIFGGNSKKPVDHHDQGPFGNSSLSFIANVALCVALYYALQKALDNVGLSFKNLQKKLQGIPRHDEKNRRKGQWALVIASVTALLAGSEVTEKVISNISNRWARTFLRLFFPLLRLGFSGVLFFSSTLLPYHFISFFYKNYSGILETVFLAFQTPGKDPIILFAVNVFKSFASSLFLGIVCRCSIEFKSFKDWETNLIIGITLCSSSYVIYYVLNNSLILQQIACKTVSQNMTFGLIQSQLGRLVLVSMTFQLSNSISRELPFASSFFLLSIYIFRVYAYVFNASPNFV